ncbi:MAG: epoxide hydrolase family protein [Sinimarinibacterium sp.]|jgi:pimeloyl-ACP methyl ester carboxylesterase
MSEPVRPYALRIEESQLADLRRRLEQTRWSDPAPVTDWSQGVPLAQLQALVEHWRTRYDWRRCEAALNAQGQHLTAIDGVDIHFLHVRSRHENALPLLLTHGWPGSVIEFLKCIGPLTDPLAHGGEARDAFHLVIPSLPGYGFSGKPRETGWGVRRIAKAWHTLMQRLGYARYVAQGGDWGAVITTALGIDRPQGLAGIHLNLPLVRPRKPDAELSPAEARMLEQLEFYARWDSGYAQQQSTRPQTLGYALADSPAGQAAWIYEKFQAWTDNTGNPESTLTADEMLDNIMLYWLPNAAASSARLYWESYRGAFAAAELHIPTGCSIFPKDIYTAPRSWAQRCIHNLVYWNELDRGGHFAAFEQPALFVDELRKCFRLMQGLS